MNLGSAIRVARSLDTDICISMSCLARRPDVPRLPRLPRLSERLPSFRNVATNPPLSSTKGDTTTTFSSPSRPRPVHPRPLPKRDLPVVKSRLPLLIGIGALGVAAWGAFLVYATNLERASAAVTRQVLATVQRHPQIKELMGDGVKVEESPWLSWTNAPGGKAVGWISGSVNLPAGHVDISFRVRGPRGAGTVYFTSVRKDKGIPFTILRFKVIPDKGPEISLLEENKQV